ncbi:MAG: NPCBM/NEW2 domain-containing protein [Pirellulales bacterium]|nr:NPCBM/NEW2 domain-containing protein [Pirellulales bacterium]
MLNRKTCLLCSAIFLAGSISASVRAADAPQPEYLSDALSDRILSASQDWGALGLNAAAAAPRRTAAKLRIQDKEYARGLGHHANGEIVVELGGEFATFEAEIGIQWQGGKTAGSAIFRIYADDKKVFDSGIVRDGDPPRPVSVSVAGAEELRLDVHDAGDGINFDCADWADARLTRDPAAAKKTSAAAVDIAPFARVAAWDPKVASGTQAGRVQEMPAEDIRTARDLLPTDRGSYLVPIENETGCIGLQWHENRLLRRLELRFPEAAAVPPSKSIELQYWSGGSAWQGTWRPADKAPEKIENRLVWTFPLGEIPRGTQKTRWIFSAAKGPIEVNGISAFSRSRWKTVDVRLESTRPGSTRIAEIEVYNGIFEGRTGKAAHHCTWDTSKPLSLKVRTSAAQRYKADRTVLRMKMPDAAFGVAVEDLLVNDCVYVPHAGVFAAREPAPIALADYLQKIAGKKTVLEQVRRQPDQDFPRAWSVVHNPIQDLGPMMLSLACDNRKFVAEREGAVRFDEYDRPDDPRLSRPGNIYDLSYTIPWRCTPEFGDGRDRKIARRLQGDWLPIPVTSVSNDAISYRQATYVAPASGTPADAPFWFRDRALCVSEFKIENDSEEANSAKLALNFSHEKNKTFQLREAKEGILVLNGDRVLALIDARNAAPLAMRQTAEGAVLSGKLSGWGSAECRVIFPAWKVDAKDYASLLEGAGTASRVESYWKALLEPATQIEVPDALLTNIIRASQVHCLLAARNEERGALVSAWASADRYGPLESESNSVIRGMDMNGQTDFARRSLDFFLKQCNEAGFITTGYTIVGTGEVLWTLGEHYQRTRDRAWMKQIAPEIVCICRWIARQREKTKLLDARGDKVPEYGLMPPGVSADWGRYAYRLFNDAQYYAGLEASARALADIGDPAAPAIGEEARRYREDIARAYHWVQARTPVVRLDDGTWAPADPAFLDCFGNVENFLPAEDGNRTWCYSIEIGAHHLAAAEALDPASQEVKWMTDYLEDVQFLRSGMGDYPEKSNRKDVFCFGGFAKLQPYYCRIAEVYALRDEVKPFVRSYFNAIPTLVSRENLSFWEHFHNTAGWNKTHETGWFLCQTRLMFVAERGDELWLAPFATNHWLKDGMKISVRNAPTRFGKVSYAIASKAAAGEIDAVVEPPPQCSAKKIVLRLRHPEGKPMRSVTVQGRPHADFDPNKETITLEPSGGKIAVRAQY